MISSLSKLVLLAGALALGGCAVGADPGEEDTTVSSALGAGEESAIGSEGGGDKGDSNGIKQETPRHRNPISLVPLDMATPGDPSPWRGPAPR